MVNLIAILFLSSVQYAPFIVTIPASTPSTPREIWAVQIHKPSNLEFLALMQLSLFTTMSWARVAWNRHFHHHSVTVHYTAGQPLLTTDMSNAVLSVHELIVKSIVLQGDGMNPRSEDPFECYGASIAKCIHSRSSSLSRRPVGI